MNITRQNYEEYFLLYVDHELNMAQRKAVESFVEENPDLRAELVMLQEAILPPDDQVTFGDKSSLLKTSSAPNPVNETNCEEYFLLYADDELTNVQKDQVEQFVYRNPQHQASFELLQQVKLMPDSSVVFPDKYALFRHEEEEKAPVVAIRWWRMAAAAAVLLFAGGMSWYLATNDQAGNAGLAGAHQGKSTQSPTLEGDHQQQLAMNDSNYAQQAPEKTATGTMAPAALPPASADQHTAAAIPPVKATKRQQQAPPIKSNGDYAVNQQTTHFTQQKSTEIKKVQPDSNNPGAPHVLLTEDVAVNNLKGQNIGKTVDATIRPATEEVMNDKAVMSSLAINRPPVNEQDLESIDPVDNKKNTMRSFFRKVSRVFDRTTNADPDQTKNSIRIASFEIALK